MRSFCCGGLRRHLYENIQNRKKKKLKNKIFEKENKKPKRKELKIFNGQLMREKRDRMCFCMNFFFDINIYSFLKRILCNKKKVDFKKKN